MTIFPIKPPTEEDDFIPIKPPTEEDDFILSCRPARLHKVKPDIIDKQKFVWTLCLNDIEDPNADIVLMIYHESKALIGQIAFHAPHALQHNNKIYNTKGVLLNGIEIVGTRINSGLIIVDTDLGTPIDEIELE